MAWPRRPRWRQGNLLLPLFVKEGISAPQPVPSMPGVLQHTRDSLRKAAVDAVQAGVGGLMLFGIPRSRTPAAPPADDPAGIIQLALRDLAAEVGDEIGARRGSVPLRVHRPRPLRTPLDRRLRGGQRRHAGAVRVDSAAPRRWPGRTWWPRAG